MLQAGISQYDTGNTGPITKFPKNTRAIISSQGHVLPKPVYAKPLLPRVSPPPHAAPKGPKASTALQARVPKLLSVPTESSAGPSSDKAGSWSQSKRWISGETKERTAFQRMLMNLHYMGADKSPFVPQTPAELTAFKAEVTEIERVKLLSEMEKMRALVRVDGKEKEQPPVLFGGKVLWDNLSPVFAIISCFDREPATQNGLVDWPSLAELKEEGDKRGLLSARCFPLPRLNILPANPRFEHRDSLYNPDGSIRWNKKKVTLGFLDITPVNMPDPDDTVSVDNIKVTELPYSFKLILDHIEGVQEEDRGFPKEIEAGLCKALQIEEAER
ncbi:hypothetical protein BGZ63DRAFT_423476 [Mariannaea sp. PMI_226]|nr:hypothetical protein BGZ63DRAFT_423476 [Mariannaea sp. PMI_226]